MVKVQLNEQKNNGHCQAPIKMADELILGLSSKLEASQYLYKLHSQTLAWPWASSFCAKYVDGTELDIGQKSDPGIAWIVDRILDGAGMETLMNWDGSQMSTGMDPEILDVLEEIELIET